MQRKGAHVGSRYDDPMRRATLFIAIATACSSSGGASPAPNDTAPCTATCNGACTDTATDRHHCGACGHDCLGGECVAGTCQKVSMIPETNQCESDIGLVSDATNLYYLDGIFDASIGCAAQYVARRAKTDFVASNATVSHVYQVKQTISAIASDATHLFVGETYPHVGGGSTGELFAMSFDGSAVVSIASTGPVAAIVSDGTTVYFTDGDFIEFCPTTGCAGSSPKTLFETKGSASMSIAGDDIVFTAPPGRVLSCARATGCGSAPNTIYSGTDTIDSMTADATDVYWTTISSVLRCPLAGCSAGPTVLASGESFIGGITVDGSAIYWGANSAIRTCPKPDCPGGPKTMAPLSTGKATVVAKHIVVDDTAVYFTTSNDVLRVAR
jgi:hypothetical protein